MKTKIKLPMLRLVLLVWLISVNQWANHAIAANEIGNWVEVSSSDWQLFANDYAQGIPGGNWKQIINGDQGYTLRSPTNTTVKRYDPEGILHIILSDEPSNVMMVRKHDNLTLNSATRPSDIVKRTLDDFRVPAQIVEQSGILLQADDLQRIDVELTGGAGCNKLVVLSAGGQVISFIYPHGHQENEGIFEQIIASFAFTSSKDNQEIDILKPNNVQIANLSVPHYYQNDSQWSCNQMGDCSDQSGCGLIQWTCNETDSVITIGDAGCAVTSYSMIFEYYTPGHFMTPLELDTCFTSNNEYTSCMSCGGHCCRGWGNLNDSACTPSGVTYLGTTTTQSTVDTDLASGYPLIGELPGHYVVITGKDGSNYTVNDPVIGNPSQRSWGEFSQFVRFRGPVPNDCCGCGTSQAIIESQIDGFSLPQPALPGLLSDTFSFQPRSQELVSADVPIENLPPNWQYEMEPVSYITQERTAVPLSWSPAQDENGHIIGYFVYWGNDPQGTDDTFTSDTAFTPSEIVPVGNPTTRYLRVAAQDDAGSISEWQTVAVWQYDPVSPIGSVEVRNGSITVQSLNAMLDLTVQDEGSEVAGMRFSDDGRIWTAWEPFTSIRNWQLENVETVQTVYVQVKDAAENISEIMTASVTAVLNVEKPSSTNYQIGCSAFSMGGGTKSSNSYTVHSTTGQSHETSLLRSSGYQVQSGFWPTCGALSPIDFDYQIYLPTIIK